MLSSRKPVAPRGYGDRRGGLGQVQPGGGTGPARDRRQSRALRIRASDRRPGRRDRNPVGLARELAGQLGVRCPVLPGPSLRSSKSSPRTSGSARPLASMVLRPIEYLEGSPGVRIVLDGFDQFPRSPERPWARPCEGPAPLPHGHHRAVRHTGLPAGAPAPSGRPRVKTLPVT